MKILWIVNMVMPELADHMRIRTSASGTWMIDLAERLSRTPGIELGIACVHGKQYQDVELSGTRYFVLPGDGKSMLFYTNRFKPLWRRVYQDFRPDLVHLHGTEYSHGLSFLRQCPQVKAVVSTQGLLTRIKDVDLGGLTIGQAGRYRTGRENTHLNGMLEQHWLYGKNVRHEAEILARVKYVNCVNTWDWSLVQSINPDLRCFQLEYNLRDAFYSAPKWSIDGIDRHTIFTNPGGVPLKGLHMLIRALAIVKRDYPDVVLVVPGMGDDTGRLVISNGYAKYINTLIRRLSLADSVEFRGRLSGEDMVNAMLRAHVVVIPSAIEGTSLMLREAMYLGVPCVASFRGGMADFVSDKHDGYLYDYQEYPYLARRIMQLFENGELCSVFSRNAARRAEAAHDRENNGRAWLEMYREIMSNDRTAGGQSRFPRSRMGRAATP